MKKSPLAILLGLTLLSATPLASAADGGENLSPHDRQLINSLLAHLRERKDLRFQREDKTYDAKSAAWYLKYKWDQNKNKVHSLEDFINLEAFGGDHNEITYYVLFNDGRKETAKQVFEDSFKKLEQEQ